MKKLIEKLETMDDTAIMAWLKSGMSEEDVRYFGMEREDLIKASVDYMAGRYMKVIPPPNSKAALKDLTAKIKEHGNGIAEALEKIADLL